MGNRHPAGTGRFRARRSWSTTGGGRNLRGGSWRRLHGPLLPLVRCALPRPRETPYPRQSLSSLSREGAPFMRRSESWWREWRGGGTPRRRHRHHCQHRNGAVHRCQRTARRVGSTHASTRESCCQRAHKGMCTRRRGGISESPLPAAAAACRRWNVLDAAATTWDGAAASANPASRPTVPQLTSPPPSAIVALRCTVPRRGRHPPPPLPIPRLLPLPHNSPPPPPVRTLSPLSSTLWPP